MTALSKEPIPLLINFIGMRMNSDLEHKMDVGEARGIKKGLKKGEAIGIGKGIEKGKIEVAKNLLQNGFTMDAIIQLTNLSKEQIEDLQKHIFDKTSVVNF